MTDRNTRKAIVTSIVARKELTETQKVIIENSKGKIHFAIAEMDRITTELTVDKFDLDIIDDNFEFQLSQIMAAKKHITKWINQG